MLMRSPASDARQALAGAIDDPDARVCGAAVAAVLGPDDREDPVIAASSEPDQARVTAEAALARLLEGDPAEKVAGLGAIHALRRRLDPARRAALLADPDPEVRAATMTALTNDEDPAETSLLLKSLSDPASVVRVAASGALAGRPTATPGVLDRLAAPDIETQMSAVAALDGHGPEVREPVLAWAEAHVERAVTYADARLVLAPSRDGPGRLDVLITALDGRERRYRDLALAAMAVLGAPAARGVIRRSLGSSDPDVRAQAIEALDSMGDRQLGAAIARLVEIVPSPTPRTPATVVQWLCDDADPWIRGLARWVRTDGDDMADVPTSSNTFDTMLRLRAVPLFERLAPEDLERIAEVATERWFEPDEALVREGDLGDELFVIVEGRVAVSRLEPDGSQRLLRTYGAGDHIGELAVLRERPRVATVVADGGSVRTLVLDGEALTAILRERPDAAMAMLATLAERVSRQ